MASDTAPASPTMMSLIGQVGRQAAPAGPDPCASSPSPGTVCTGGAIYLGTLSSVKYMVTAGGCGYEPSGTSATIPTATFTPTCAGTDAVQKSWAINVPAPTALGVNTGFTSLTDGPGNTVGLATNYGDTAAAKYCHHLDVNGYSDWFLPARDELNLIYTNKASVPGVAGAASYWSSSENTDNEAWPQRMSDGTNDPMEGKDNLNRVRCVRRF